MTNHGFRAGQQFHELYHRLSRPQANALLNDCIYELPAAWKFLTALKPELPILVALHGFSGVPFAFARHLQRVDIWGLNQSEAALFQELAQFKDLSNCRLCSAAQDIQGPYGLILWLPTRKAVEAHREIDWLIQVLRHLHPQGELWLAHCYKPDWSNPLHRLRRLMRRLKSREHEPLPATIRLLPLAEPIPHRTLLDNLAAKFAVRSNQPPHFHQINHIGIVPHWSAPAQIAPLPSFHARPEKPVENARLLQTLEPKKFLETYHALAQFGPDSFSPFLSRLVHELARRESGSHFQLNHYRVLAGGKVQIDARWKRRQTEQGVFIKLPLVPFAGARLTKQSDMLRYLQLHENLRRFDSASMPFAPSLQKVFPRILAQGEFEKQSYFLESRVKGAPLSRLFMPNEVFRKICDVLFSFWHEVQFRCGAFVDIDGNKFAQLFQQPLANLIAWAQPPRQYDKGLRRLEDYFDKQFSGQRLFLGLVHGDFSTKNILANPKNFELSGIIDWDIAARQSLPFLDVLHFFVRLDSSSFREAPPQIAMRLIQPNAQAFHWPYVEKAMKNFGFDAKLLPAAVAYYWVQRLQVYLDSPKYLDTHFMQRHFYDMLDFFDRTILI